MTFRTHFPKRLLFAGIGGLIGLFILSVVWAGLFLHRYVGRIYPNVYVESIDVGGLTKAEADVRITQAIHEYRQGWPATFRVEAQLVEVPLPETAAVYANDETLDTAYAVGRTFSLKGLQELVSVSYQPTKIPIQVSIDDVWLANTAASISAQIDVPVIPTHLEVRTSSKGEKYIEAVQGHSGTVMNQSMWIEDIRASLHTLTKPNTILYMDEITPLSDNDKITFAVERATNLLSSELILTLNPQDTSSQTWVLQGTDLVKFVEMGGGYESALITDYVSGVEEAVNRPPKDAKFNFDATSSKVSEFAPAEDGIAVLVPETTTAIITALDSLARKETVQPVALVTSRQAPEVTLESVNRMGIKERIGVGTSTYKGSIAGRVHNVELAAARINGTLVKPGEEFSFNNAVGEISSKTGYQQAYIIQDGRTQLGDGGGVCQDSTTVFRAALNAGLPITMRRGHAYRVGYYEQDAKPGLDATVYSPSTDLRFTNDTPGYILIQTQVDTPNRALTVSIYGTSDGRTSTITDHILWDVTPPPPDVFTDDPTLAVGTVKQIDWKAPGSKAKFTYTVERGGAVVFEKTFLTTYKPWAAVFLRGTKQ